MSSTHASTASNLLKQLQSLTAAKFDSRQSSAHWRILYAALLAAALFMLLPKAHATIWEFTEPASVYGNNVGDITNLTGRYNTVSETFSWTFDIERNAQGDLANGFWLVLNDGPNPKGIPNELAIMYFDATDINAPVLTVYTYNGQRAPTGDNSWDDGNGDGVGGDPDPIFSSITDVGTTFNLIAQENSADSLTLGFTIDATGINAHDPLFGDAADWEGVRFDELIGFWFHPSILGTTAYDLNGFLTQYDVIKRGSFDRTNVQTTEVPEPSSMLLMLAGMGLAVRRKKQR